MTPETTSGPGCDRAAHLPAILPASIRRRTDRRIIPGIVTIEVARVYRAEGGAA